MDRGHHANSFGIEVRRLREERGWRLVDLSEELVARGVTKGASVQHLSEIERGQPVSRDLAKALDGLFGCAGSLFQLRIQDQFSSPVESDAHDVDLHIFFPARISGELPQVSMLDAQPELTVPPHVTIESDPHEQLHVFPYGVAVLHRHVALGPTALHRAARRRHGQIAQADRAVQDYLDEHNLQTLRVIDDKPYAFSCFVVRSDANKHITRQATRALVHPNGLWPFNLTDPTDAELTELASAEANLLAGEAITEALETFDVHRSHYGAASWAAVCVHPAHEASEIESLLIDWEVQLQGLWCYTSYVQRHTTCLPGYESPFIKASLRKLAAPDPLEHESQRLLREALLNTSRIVSVVEHAVGALTIAS